MKTFTRQFTVYKFSELNEDAQQRVLEDLYDVNVDHDWWECTYEDAKTIGLEITEFDLDRGAHCECKLILDAEQSINEVLDNHGPSCKTYDIARKFKEEFLLAGNDDDKYMDCTEEYLQEMSEEYLSILRKEYEYLMSREAVIETIESNEWTFTKEGRMENE